ncbi:CG4607 [Drosophila busckii]|uniref:CG4607 n=1 Tax=Drosophila busckii TaxID=30019 RepID=A0A0M4E851_DROBS|nr:solute carrier family 2, facilitated glucose transporter member 8 [Drosophila busckii]ALC40834.1 CG4607 [Drosophila busckii]
MSNLEEEQQQQPQKHAQIVAGWDRPYTAKPLGEQFRAVRRQTLMVIFANMGVLSTGLSLALPTVALTQLTSETEPAHLSKTEASWFASINTLSCPLGGLLSGFLLDRIGRKYTLYVLNILGIISWAMLGTATGNEDSLMSFSSQLLVSRFIIGLVMGLASAPSGVYAAEISLPKIRGSLILGTSISVALGITVLYCIGYFIRDDFRLIALICCGYQIVALLCVFFCVESHSWLLSKRRVEEAKKSLNYFRGLERTTHLTHPEVLAEFNLLQKSLQLPVGETKKASFLSNLRLPEVYKPLFILMGLFAFQQLSGIFVIIVYAVQISTKTDNSIDPFMCAVLIGVARVLTTCPMGYVLEKWGRRLAGLISTFGMCFSMLLLAGHGYFEFLRLPYFTVAAIVGFIILSTLGLYTLPFFMISELFPQKVRGPASGITVAVGMFFAFLCIKTYPDMQSSIGMSNCFLVFAAMSFLAMLFIYWTLPETRGLTLLQIEQQFRSKTKTINQVEMEEMLQHRVG